MGDVTGTVTYQGKPVVGASIVFLPSKREIPVGAAVTDSGGAYKLGISGREKGAVVGDYKVTIVLNAPYDGPLPSGMSLEAARETLLGKALIPEKYFKTETSGLTADVKPGTNKFDFTLQD